jgi:hypothetical protein
MLNTAKSGPIRVRSNANRGSADGPQPLSGSKESDPVMRYDLQFAIHDEEQ